MIKILILILIFYFLFNYMNIETNNLTNKSNKITNKNNKITNVNYKGKFKHTKKKTIKKLAEGMKLVHDIFSKNNIFYQIAYGSLLGSIRHQKIIPWDDDADLHIFLKDIDKIMALKPEFNKHGWTLEKDWKLIKVKQLDKNGKVLKESFIDLFIINIDNNEYVNRCLSNDINLCHQMPANHVWWHKWYNFPSDLIKGRKLYKFHDKTLGYNFEMYGPINGEKILKFWYGKDCLNICQSPIYDHNTGKYIKSKKIPCNELKMSFGI